jgi:hypothetical protein
LEFRLQAVRGAKNRLKPEFQSPPIRARDLEKRTSVYRAHPPARAASRPALRIEE